MQAATAGVPQHGPWAVSQRNRKMQSNVNSCLGCAVLLQLLSGIKDGNELPVEEDVHLSLPVPCANGEVQVHSVGRPAPQTPVCRAGLRETVLKAISSCSFLLFLLWPLTLRNQVEKEETCVFTETAESNFTTLWDFFPRAKRAVVALFSFYSFLPPRILLINSPR